MKILTKNIKSSNTFQRSVYDPALDHLEGKIFFQEKLDDAKEFLKKYGLPKAVIDKLNKKALSNQ
jgi:hypothetical protein